MRPKGLPGFVVEEEKYTVSIADAHRIIDAWKS